MFLAIFFVPPGIRRYAKHVAGAGAIYLNLEKSVLLHANTKLTYTYSYFEQD